MNFHLAFPAPLSNPWRQDLPIAFFKEFGLFPSILSMKLFSTSSVVHCHDMAILLLLPQFCRWFVKITVYFMVVSYPLHSIFINRSENTPQELSNIFRYFSVFFFSLKHTDKIIKNFGSPILPNTVINFWSVILRHIRLMHYFILDSQCDSICCRHKFDLVNRFHHGTLISANTSC